ncbi:MAG: alpha/beta hydrolase [Candidatus Eiseniibacteriota bacterium]
MGRVQKVLALLILLVLTLYGVIGWYVSNRIGNEGLSAAYDHAPPAYDDATIVAVGDRVVALMPVRDDSSRVRRGLSWGLRWKGGWASAGPVQGVFRSGAVRSFALGEGEMKAGTRVDLSTTPESSDPTRACGLPFSDVAITTELGLMPAWLIPASIGGNDAAAMDADTSTTWVVFVHGKGAVRTQALPTLPIYARRGLPELVISYRNDPGAPASPDGEYHYGRTEWKDLEAACAYALSQGAERFVLVGPSMAGGIILDFLEESPLADRVQGAVLDSPAIDFGRTVDLGIREATLPGLGTRLPPLSGDLGKLIATLRFGVDWRDYDLIRRAGRLRAPLLVLHGDADDVVPFEGSEALRAARPDLVTLVRFPGARHVEGWNLEPDRYESEIVRFLDSIATMGRS